MLILDRLKKSGLINAAEERGNAKRWMEELRVKAPNMFVKCRTDKIAVYVEIDKSFGGIAVIQSLFGENVFEDLFKFSFFNHSFQVFSVVPNNGGQVFIKREFI